MSSYQFVRTYPLSVAPEFDDVSPAVISAIDSLVSKVVQICCCDKREASQVISELARERAGLLELGGKVVVQRIPRSVARTAT